jgi:type I restriction enzyme S subunit
MNKIALSGKHVAYPEYKDSCVEWLGNTPNHWGAKALKFLCTYNDEVLADSISHNHEIEYVDIGSVSATEGITKTEKMMFGKAPSRARRIVRDGDVIISTVRTYLEAIAPIDNPLENLVVSTGFAVIRPNSLLHKRYAAYCLRAQGFIKEVVAQSVGISYPAINASDLVNIKVPEPSFDEQEKIANFLDHETAKIDTLIEKQKQLIKLLKEKRQAVISHAVTKGLNPKAHMRDSSIEWLGEVPVHWDVVKLSFRYKVLLGKMLDDKKITGDFLGEYLRNTDVQWDRINTEDLPKMDFRPEESERYSVRNGDLIVCEGGDIGRSAIWEHEERCFYQKALHRLRPHDYSRDHTRFMFYVMFDAVYQERFSGGVAKATIAHLPAETFRQYKFAYPPFDEQVEIAVFLDKMKGKFEAIEISAQIQIDLLQERRTALISAAVTGKIDVRNWSAPHMSNIAKSDLLTQENN